MDPRDRPDRAAPRRGLRRRADRPAGRDPAGDARRSHAGSAGTPPEARCSPWRRRSRRSRWSRRATTSRPMTWTRRPRADRRRERDAGLVPVAVYFVGDTPSGPRLYREFQRLGGGVPGGGRTGRNGSPTTPTTRPSGRRARSAPRRDDGVINVTIDDRLSPRPAGVYDARAGGARARADRSTRSRQPRASGCRSSSSARRQPGRPGLRVPTSEPLTNGPSWTCCRWSASATRARAWVVDGQLHRPTAPRARSRATSRGSCRPRTGPWSRGIRHRRDGRPTSSRGRPSRSTCPTSRPARTPSRRRTEGGKPFTDTRTVVIE